METKKRFVVGVDIGGTNTTYGIVNPVGNVVASESIKTHEHADINDYIRDLSDGIRELTEEVGGLEQINGIGVGAPKGNYYTGMIEDAVNLRWRGNIPFANMLSKALSGTSVKMTNDANAAALGEMTYGATEGVANFVEVTLGTGIGSGIVVNGQVLYGYTGSAGEFGHITVRPEGERLCGCGRIGCLETYCSATGVARTARWYVQQERGAQSLLHKMPLEELTSKHVFEAAEQGDQLAKEIFDFTGEILGSALANLVTILSPEVIVLFGGLTKAGDYILAPTRQRMEEQLLPMFRNTVKLIISELPESDTALLGASALGWE